MSIRPRNNTAYASYVFSNLIPIVRSGAGAYSYSELASMVGLKPTAHFRRRVGQLVEDGRLVIVHTFTPRGGIEHRFMTPIDESTEVTF